MQEQVKVYAYITHGSRLLVFRERGFPEGGVQIPGGTPEIGESHDVSALREAKEETGLANLGVVQYLGEELFDVSIYGKDEIHRRKFYHLICEDETPERWAHEETDPSIRTENTPEHIIYDFWWWDLRTGMPELQLGFDAKLPTLLDRLDIHNS